MQIVSLNPPENNCYVGEAVSTRGRRYRFYANRNGTLNGTCDRYEGKSPDGLNWWLHIRPHASLRRLVKRRVRSEERGKAVAS